MEMLAWTVGRGEAKGMPLCVTKVFEGIRTVAECSGSSSEKLHTLQAAHKGQKFQIVVVTTRTPLCVFVADIKAVYVSQGWQQARVIDL